MRFENIESLLDGTGQITIGRVGPVPCGATASYEHHGLAMLARKPGETLLELMQRLDEAIEDALERDIFADEING